MRVYDQSEPLIVIHVPKAAGTTSRKFFQHWYGDGFMSHYFDEEKGQLPEKYNLEHLHSIDKPILLHGHFNRLRGFGVEDYYPEIKQFVTILRDPFELTVSSYFYTRKVGASWKNKARIPDRNLTEYLFDSRPNMLNHFPRVITSLNYKDIIDEYFVAIGITEHLHESMKWIAHKLGLDYDGQVPGHCNVTQRDEEVPDDLREIFVEKNPLEFLVYDYALQQFIQRGLTPE